jgi:phage-related tail fiber protein
MPTIADMIETRLRQIEAQYAAESAARQDRASGGAVQDPLALARAREQRLWDALQGDKVWVWTPDGHKRLSEVTELASGLKAEMRVERAANGVTPALKHMECLDRTVENIIKTAASRASDREAAAMRKSRASR